ncbi:MAG: thiol-disulfide isomerase [Acidobacteriota bacterium]|nr:thiol-disulfide isomerase [Acidobacteriota bacterium]
MKRLSIILAGLIAALAISAGSAINSSAINSNEAAGVTFTKDVAPIIFNKCANCHRPGEVAPMLLTSYAEVRPWSKAIREEVIERTMPPWFADPQASTLHFANDRRLSQREIDTIVAWVDAGAPKGDDKDLPPMPKYAPGWTFGEPDVVIEMPIDFEVPAEGELPMQNFYVKVPFNEERWVEKVELRPGNPAVVHHSIANVVRLPEGTKIVNGKAVRDGASSALLNSQSARDTGGLSEGGSREVALSQDAFTRSGAFKLVGQAPGKGFEQHYPGTAKRILPGMYVQFNMHYQPSGRAEKDRSRLGLWFAKKPVSFEVLTKGVTDNVFIEGKELAETRTINGKEVKVRGRLPNIPPNAANWEISAETPIKEAITLYAFAPHMHLRGKDIKYTLVWPDGRQQVLLNVPKFDFNWQLHYELENPLKIPAGSKMLAVAHYDNSVNNRYNPAPNKEVFWSEQSWDEMFIPWFEYTVDSKDLTKTQSASKQQ